MGLFSEKFAESTADLLWPIKHKQRIDIGI